MTATAGIGARTVLLAIAAACAVAARGEPVQDADQWKTSFDVNRQDLVPQGRNPYFPLVPGHRVHLADRKGDVHVVITVLDDTEVVDGVTTRVVEERETEDGELVEVSRNFFAVDKRTNDVYYFGEDVDDYKDGKVVGHGGSWRSGVNQATFGLIMPAAPRVGQRYYQEQAPKIAMDRSEVMDLAATLETPMKKFTYCLYVKESSPLERGLSHKWYAAGIGMIGDDDLRLVEVEAAP